MEKLQQEDQDRTCASVDPKLPVLLGLPHLLLLGYPPQESEVSCPVIVIPYSVFAGTGCCTKLNC
jgi:hypothetical protein